MAAAALGVALMATVVAAGLVVTFSVAVMPNQAGLDDRTFVEVTQRYDANPVFAASFGLALLTLLVATALATVHARGAALAWTVVALALVIVVFVITGALHIPLNEAIDRLDPAGDAATLAQGRRDFEASWVAGNIARSVLVLGAVAALVRAVFDHGRAQGRAQGRVSTGGPRSGTIG